MHRARITRLMIMTIQRRRCSLRGAQLRKLSLTFAVRFRSIPEV
jgi:hypothetical protein